MSESNEINQQALSDNRHKMIAEAAYFIAEQREFKGEYQLNDWLEAEAKIIHAYGPDI